MIVQNCHALTYFGPRQVRLSETAGLDTGTISLSLLRRSRPADIASVALRLLSGRAGAVTRHPQAHGLPGLREATITSVDGSPLPVDADGEFIGEYSQITYGVKQGALRVIA